MLTGAADTRGNRRRARRLAVIGLALAVAAVSIAGCSRRPLPRRVPPPKPKVAGIRLVMVVVVDQLAWDTLMRFRPALRGGLARLLDSGVTFSDAHHRHAMTATAPGHATLATGLTPRHHGVVANYWFDRNANREVYSAEDPVSEEVGPVNLLATALPDWVRQRDPWGRTFTAAGKDRSAVMLGGKRPTGAFWFDPEVGGFVTSHRYHRAPGWVMAFNRRPLLRERFGTLWQPLPLPPRVDASRLGVVQLEGSGLPTGFPHAYGPDSTRPDEGFYEAIFDSPAIDEYLADFARELVARERLGLDDHLDYLGLSFSAVDSVGHTYGPHSREALDAVLRLDRALGELLAAIEQQVGRNRMVVALSADHGVAPMPERQRRLGLRGDRESPADVACLQSVLRRLDDAYGRRDWFAYDLYLDAHAGGAQPRAASGARPPDRRLARRLPRRGAGVDARAAVPRPADRGHHARFPARELPAQPQPRLRRAVGARLRRHAQRHDAQDAVRLRHPRAAGHPRAASGAARGAAAGGDRGPGADARRAAGPAAAAAPRRRRALGAGARTGGKVGPALEVDPLPAAELVGGEAPLPVLLDQLEGGRDLRAAGERHRSRKVGAPQDRRSGC